MIRKLLLIIRSLFLKTADFFFRKSFIPSVKLLCLGMFFLAGSFNQIYGLDRYLINSGTWNTAAIWSASSGGSGGASVPVAGDNVFIEGGFTVTTNNTVLCANLNISAGSTMIVGGYSITVSGNTAISGTLIHNANGGTKRYTGLVTVNSGGAWDNIGDSTINFRGGITNNGTFNSGSGLQTFSNNSQNIMGTISIENITISSTLTNNGVLTVSTALAGNGAFVNSASGTVNLGGTSSVTNLTATAIGNTVNYNGSTSQSIKVTTYYNLSLSTPSSTLTSVKTLSGIIKVNNLWAISTKVQVSLSSFTHSAGTLTLGGAGPLISTWGSTGSNPVATNTNNTFFTASNAGQISITNTPPGSAIDNNYAYYGVTGEVNGVKGEYDGLLTLTAPVGNIFINVKFASYGLPGGIAPNFTIGSCHAFNSRTVTTGLLGNTSATIPASGTYNDTFGDPCLGISKNYSVVAIYSTPICSGDNPGVITGSIATGGNGPKFYLWEVSTSGPTNGYLPAPGVNTEVNYTILAGITQKTWYRRTVTSGIYSDETIVVIPVNTMAELGKPISAAASVTSVCSGNTITLTATGGGMGSAGGYAEWTTGSCTGPIVGRSALANGSLVITPTANATYYVKYKNSCGETPCVNTVAVNNPTSISLSTNSFNTCYNSSLNIPIPYSGTTGTPNSYSIDWNAVANTAGLVDKVNVGNTFVTSSGSISNGITIPTNMPAGVYNGIVTVRNSVTNCVSFNNTITLTINAKPVITGNLTVCIGSTTLLAGSGTANTTNPWVSSSTAVATVSSTGLVKGISAGSSVISYTDSNGCSVTATVTVNPLPTITGSLNVCIGSTTLLAGSGIANTTDPWVSSSTAVATVSSTGLVKGISAGTSVITYTNSTGCLITSTVTVNPLPSITGSLNVCIGSTTLLAGSGTANTTDPWVSSSTAVATVSGTGLVKGISAGTSVITYTNSTGCLITATVTVNPLPSITGSLNVCIGSTTLLAGSGTANTTDPWVSSSAAVATVSSTGLVKGISAGTSVITYTNSTGCLITATVTVNPLPSITGSLNVCIGSTTLLAGSGTANTIDPWVSSSTAVATVNSTGLVKGISAGTSVITYTNSTGCLITSTVTVNPLPSITGSLNVCIGSTTLLAGSGTANTTNPWVSSAAVATVSSTGTVTGISAGTSIITYTNSNGCFITATVTVNAIPTITVGPTVDIGCTNLGSVTLNNLPLGNWKINQTGFALATIDSPTSSTISYTVTGLAAGSYYFSVSIGACTSPQTGVVNISDDLTTIWDGNSWSNGKPDGNKKVLVTAAFPKQPFTVDDLFVSACSLTITSSDVVIVPSGVTLTISNAVKTNGKLEFKNNSSLVQSNEDPTINSGDISYERISTPIYQKDYIYWSSPVQNQKLADLSPGTDPTKFYYNDGTNWIQTNRQNTMTMGKGYIIRGPLSYSNSAKQTFPAVFKGVPNNGSLEGELLSKTKYHLIGNPYPSALNVDALIDQNSTLLNGTIYFWTHNTPINSALAQDYQYTTDDYATYNLSGGVSARSDVNHDLPSGTDNGIKPTGKIAAGQAFFVSTRTDGKVKFNNSMRVGGTNGQFFKTENTAKETVLEKNRIWLNMTNDKGAFKQLLVGYIEGATNSYENRFDGVTYDGNMYLDFYSVNNGNKFVIQGRALPFDDSDLVPLGYRTTIAGNFTVSIDEVDGKMSNQAIYVQDKVTGAIHDLRTSNYTFKTEAGTFTDRLILRYTGKTLGTDDFENSKDGILVAVKNSVVSIVSSKENLKEVTIFDITGKLLYNKKKVSNTELQIQNLQSGDQVLLVKVTLENEATTTRKIIFQ